MAESRLICPDHPDDDVKHYLVEQYEDGTMVECPDCEYTCQNFIKYPEVEVMDFDTGETYRKNILTGEIL